MLAGVDATLYLRGRIANRMQGGVLTYEHCPNQDRKCAYWTPVLCKNCLCLHVMQLLVCSLSLFVLALGASVYVS